MWPLLLGGLAAGFCLAWLAGSARLATARREAARTLLRASEEAARLAREQETSWERSHRTRQRDSGRFEALGQREIESREERVGEEASRLDRQAVEFERREAELAEEERQIAERRGEALRLAARLARRRAQTKSRLLERSGRRESDAREAIKGSVVQGILDEVGRLVARRADALAASADLEARRIIGVAIGRCQVSHAHPHAASTVHLPRGEDGSPARRPEGADLAGGLRRLLGAEIAEDAQAGTIHVTHPDGVAREAARRTVEEALARPLDDVELAAVVARHREALDREVLEAGREVLARLGLSQVSPGLATPLGRLRWRTSFGQNILWHSVEVAYLCSGLAAELGADPLLALRAGLFHDLGKALDHGAEEGHPELGAQALAEAGEPEEVVRAASGHHAGPERQDRYSALVAAADAISAARTGARRESFEQYVQRLERLETIANSFFGVETAFAVQAGRELRVLVDPAEVDDRRAKEICAGIAREIQQQLHLPGRVRITLIREKRIVEYAR